MAVSGDSFPCHKEGSAPVTEYADARDAVNYPTMHRTARETRNYPAQSISSAEVEESCPKPMAGHRNN